MPMEVKKALSILYTPSLGTAILYQKPDPSFKTELLTKSFS